MHGDALRHDIGQTIPAALIKVQRRQIVVRRRHHGPLQVQAPREQFRFRNQMPAYAGPLPHRVGGKGDHVQRIAEEPVRERAGQVLRHERDERRHLIDVHDFAERDDLRTPEVAFEERPNRGSIGVDAFPNEHRRQIQPRPARAHDLQLRLLPVDELSAPGAPQDRWLRPELIGGHPSTSPTPLL